MCAAASSHSATQNHICLNFKLYLSEFQIVLSLNFKLYLSEFQIVFVWISNCICPNWQMYFGRCAAASSHPATPSGRLHQQVCQRVRQAPQQVFHVIVKSHHTFCFGNTCLLFARSTLISWVKCLITICLFRLCLVAEERMVGIAGKISHIEDSLGWYSFFNLLHNSQHNHTLRTALVSSVQLSKRNLNWVTI